PPYGVRPRLGRGSSRRLDPHRVPSPAEKLGYLGRVAGRAADIGRPDPRHDQDLQTAGSASVATSRRTLSRLIRASSTAHSAAKTTVEASTAPPAPVAV